ncbi:MAG: hypothetical protein ABH848_02915 [Candidatus Omnitrophota bacterium]
MKTYDFALTWNSDKKEKFVKWLKEESSLKGLRFLLIDSNNASMVIDDLEKGKLQIKFLLDNEANYNDPKDVFARLCYAAKDANGFVVCDPDDARQASNKAIAHYDLVNANIVVPYTIVVRNWKPDDTSLTKAELKKLGAPFIIKPASGFGQKGVVKNATGSIAEIAEARHFNRGDDFLIQEKIEPVFFGEKQGWFRVYFLFGEIIPCWWNTENGHYEHLTLKDMHSYKLTPLARITSKIAELTNMVFFTTEIAITGKGKDRRFVCIDYVNDQPELCVRPGKGGPVHEVVKHIAERIIDIVWRMQKAKQQDIHRSIWLAKAQTEDETI